MEVEFSLSSLHSLQHLIAKFYTFKVYKKLLPTCQIMYLKGLGPGFVTPFMVFFKSFNFKGRDFSHDETLDVPTQVELLIKQATSHENLCQCYIGW